MLQAVERDDITEPAICALRHLTSRHDQARQAQEDVRHGIPTLVKLLGPESHYPLIKAVIGLCRNLGLGPQNQQYLRDAGAIPKLVDLLFRADSEMKRGVFSDHEGVVPEDVAEGCTGALHVLARDQTNRSLIRQSNVIPTICGFLSSTNENMQRSAGKFSAKPLKPISKQLLSIQPGYFASLHRTRTRSILSKRKEQPPICKIFYTLQTNQSPPTQQRLCIEFRKISRIIIENDYHRNRLLI